MREYVLLTASDVPADELWAVAADVRGWPGWANRAGPGPVWSGLTVEAPAPPERVTVVAAKFLARVRFEFAFESRPRGTRVRVAVTLRGPLGFAYRRALDRYLQSAFSGLVARLIERARVGTQLADACSPGREALE